MRGVVLVIASGLAVGCAGHRVHVELPAAPAVELAADAVAIVAADRECRDVANALVDELARVGALTVDPTAPTRLYVYGCTQAVAAPVVDVRLEDDASGRRSESREILVDGRAQAAVDVVRQGDVVARLVGAGRHTASGDLASSPGIERAMARNLPERVAVDLVDQIRPVPRLAVRRVYPNAAEGTAADLLDRAVAAELAGDLPAARDLALAALRERPTARAEAYLRELERLAR